MDSVSVNKILITPLKRIQVDGGDVLHGMKRSDPGYLDFGEVYFSIVESGAVKAWKRHLRMTLNFVVPLGEVLFAFEDQDGAYREVVLGENRYARLTVPPNIWFGFKGLFPPRSILVNIASIQHDPKEVEHRDIGEVNYNWKVK